MDNKEFNDIINHFLDSILQSTYPDLHTELLGTLESNLDFRFDRLADPKQTLIQIIGATIRILENNSSSNAHKIYKQLNSNLETISNVPITGVIVRYADEQGNAELKLEDFPDYTYLINDLRDILSEVQNE